MAVYATHKNWKTVADGLQTQACRRRRPRTQQLKTAHNRRVEDLDREKTAAEQQVRKLETERVSLADRNAQIQTELDRLQADSSASTSRPSPRRRRSIKGLATEVTGLRQRDSHRAAGSRRGRCQRRSTPPKSCTR